MTGAILAGGAATRFGGEAKGLRPLHGRRLVDAVAAALRQASDALLVVANAPESDVWLPGVRRVPDLRPGQGPLGGLHAALHAAGGPVLLLAWDMPFVPAGLLRALRALGQQGADVALPASDRSGRGVEPLCGWYAPSCLPAIEAALDAGRRDMLAFHSALRVAMLPATDVAAWGDPARLFANVNTPGDLDALASDAPAPLD